MQGLRDLLGGEGGCGLRGGRGGSQPVVVVVAEDGVRPQLVAGQLLAQQADDLHLGDIAAAAQVWGQRGSGSAEGWGAKKWGGGATEESFLHPSDPSVPSGFGAGATSGQLTPKATQEVRGGRGGSQRWVAGTQGPPPPALPSPPSPPPPASSRKGPAAISWPRSAQPSGAGDTRDGDTR